MIAGLPRRHDVPHGRTVHHHVGVHMFAELPEPFAAELEEA